MIDAGLYAEIVEVFASPFECKFELTDLQITCAVWPSFQTNQYDALHQYCYATNIYYILNPYIQAIYSIKLAPYNCVILLLSCLYPLWTEMIYEQFVFRVYRGFGGQRETITNHKQIFCCFFRKLCLQTFHNGPHTKDSNDVK